MSFIKRLYNLKLNCFPSKTNEFGVIHKVRALGGGGGRGDQSQSVCLCTSKWGRGVTLLIAPFYAQVNFQLTWDIKIVRRVRPNVLNEERS